jgi:hypothetical protein
MQLQVGLYASMVARDAKERARRAVEDLTWQGRVTSRRAVRDVCITERPGYFSRWTRLIEFVRGDGG